MAIIDKPSDYFNTKLYTGTGSELAITGVGFQSDMTWIKGRSGATEHVLTDSVRGVTKEISSNDTGAEETVAQGLTAFGSDGFTVGTDGSYNTSSATYASWNFKAGGTAVSNTDGSITSSVSANTTSGFSIVSFTGTGSNATIGHGLGLAPAFIVTKSRTDALSWRIYHQSLGNATSFDLDQSLASFAAATSWNSTTPTSSVFSVGSAASTNRSSNNFIAYCFADVQGYSKFGSYTGNGSTDGTFVYTGFKPAFVMLKKTSGTGNWQMFDDKRVGYNPDNDVLRANLSNTECTSCVKIDTLSNGFKLRNTDGDGNTSGGTYIYMSFASEPFTTSTTNGSIPATAR